MSAPRAVLVLGAGLLALTLAACSSGRPELKSTADLAERCDIARDADFAGDGKWKFDRYLESLARTSGAPYDIQPREFQLLVSRAPAPVVGGHPVGGEIACSWGKRYIYLYREALSDRTLAITYNTIAREYFHHVQVRRDGVSCNSSVDGLAALQSEARDWAQKVAPLCR